MAMAFTKLSREQRDEIGALYGKEKPKGTADRFGITEVYVRTIQWRWARKNEKPLEGRKIKITPAGTSVFGAGLEEYLSHYRCEPVEPDLITEFGVTLVDCGRHQCLWPIGVDLDGARRFCGKLRHDRKSYCGFHYTKSLAAADDMAPETVANLRCGYNKDGTPHIDPFRDAFDHLEAA